MKLFTYGTLKKGQSRAHILKDGTFLGHAVSIDPFLMKVTSGYDTFPVLFEGGEVPVSGEMYEFDDEAILDRLDMIESNGYLYEREKRYFILEDRRREEAWVYIGNNRYWGSVPLADGDKSEKGHYHFWR